MKPDDDKQLCDCTFNDADWKREFDAATGLVLSVLAGFGFWVLTFGILYILLF